MRILNTIPTLVPPYLKPGDLVGITCPAGYFCIDDAANAVEALEKWGYRVKFGKTVGPQYYTYSDTDAARAADLQNMLDDREIKAILFGRGGYGTIRIIDVLDFNRFYRMPKWLCGYSDITVVHSFVQSQLHIPTLHCEMCIDLKYGNADASADTIRRALRGDKLSYSVDAHAMSRPGTCKGLLVGGNLSLLAAMVGSSSDLNMDGKILFIEDVHEYLYRLDEMLWTLKRAGKLDRLAGLVVGGFTRLKYDPEDPPFGEEIQEIIFDKVRDTHFPVCFGFPAGHQFDNFSLRLGLPHRLRVTTEGSLLQED